MKIIIIYIIIIIIQYIYSKQYKININDSQISFNNENYDKLFNIFKIELNKKIKLIENNNLSIDEWFDFLNKNPFIIVDNYKYYFFVDEIILEKKVIIQRVYGEKGYDNISWDDMLKLNKDTLIFTKYTTDEDMLINAYNSVSANIKNNTKLKYFWVDPISNNPTLKETLFLRWDDTKTKRTGLIGIGLGLQNLNHSNIKKYSDIIHMSDLIYTSLSTFIISNIIFFTEKKNPYIKSILFLIISNAYILFYLNKYEGRTNIQHELSKITYINSAALSIAFLSGINIYIIGFLRNKNIKSLFIQSSSIFIISVSLLMISILQYTNLTEINYMISNRISNELLFNFSIVLNISILINFILYNIT